MALNYSHRPIFSARLPDDNLVQGGSQEKNIHDILPADPFGMDISSTVTAITGWLEDLGVSDYGGYSGGESGHHPIFAGLNVWLDTTAMDLQPYLGQSNGFDTMFRSDRFDGFVTNEELGCFVDGGCIRGGCGTMEAAVFGRGDVCGHGNSHVPSNDNADDRMFSFDEFVTEEEVEHCIGCDTMEDVKLGCGDSTVHGNVSQEVDGVVDEVDDGSPHPALSFALAFLGVRDLLSVERVCKSLRFTVQNDPLLWKSIEIDHPLNTQITDDALLRLTNRAQGHLQCLSLVECKWVTEDGLRRVLESNLKLTKLSVPGCMKLQIDGVMSCLKAFQPRAIYGIKCLRVAGRPVSSEQFEELVSLLGIYNHADLGHHKPHFYSRGSINLSCADDRPIDVELCPKCEKVKLVYDCTTQTCQAKDQAAHLCRACIQCIHRCYQCGRCVDDVIHEETFCLDFVCSYCLPDLSTCQEGHDIGSSSSVAPTEVDG